MSSLSSTSDRLFTAALGAVLGMYVLLLLVLLLADASFIRWADLRQCWADEALRASFRLTLVSCTLSALLAVLVALPSAYILARCRFFGKAFVEVICDIPIILPPLVLGVSFLILVNHVRLGGASLEEWVGRWSGGAFGITFQVAAVILCQFTVAAAYCIRSLRGVFEEISPRTEAVALTLGCSRSQAFWRVVLPESRRGIGSAFTMAWARSLGEFGPLLVFAGITPFKTEVLSSSVYLRFTTGDLHGAVAVSLLMISVALGVLLTLRLLSRRAQP
ncbi:MAG: hypothetical protein RL095_1680 [Verrucomicrobiota bacterium]|jgi:molybdate transport system permease protein